MRSRDGAAVVRHVLSYFSDRCRLADFQNDRAARLHYEQCWALAFVAYYGPNLLPPAYRIPKLAPAVEAPREVPPWKREMLARPLRKIVRRRVVTLRGAGPEPDTITTMEELECGHEMPASVALEGAAPAKRRRCAQCAEGDSGLHLVRKAA